MYRLIQTGENKERCDVNLYRIETEKLVVNFLNETGTIISVYDKKSGQKKCGDMLIPRCYFDDGDTWGFNIEGYDTVPINFIFQHMCVIEAGKLRTTVKGTYRFRDSILEIYYTFYTDETYFDVFYRVNWNEKHYVLKLETEVKDERHTVAVPYGSVEKAAKRPDVPLGKWLKTDDFSIVADSIFSYNMQDHILGFTVLRSPIYGDLRLGELNYDEDYDIISQGISEGKLRVDFCCGTWKQAEMFLNQPVIIIEANHNGNFPTENSYYGISGGNVLVQCCLNCNE